MKNNKYNLCTNVVENKKLKGISRATIGTLAKNLANTLGPFGATTIVKTPISTLITKDGFEILKMINFNDPVAQTIKNEIQNTSEGMVTTVGDGSTSCIEASHFLYESMISGTLDVFRTQEIISKMNVSIEKIIKEIKNRARYITEDNKEAIKNIAKISLNNDEDISEVIYNIYDEIGLQGFINIDYSQSSKTSYEKFDGFQLNKGFFDPIFRNAENDECVLHDTAIIAINSSFNSDVLKTVLGKILNLYTEIKSGKHKKYKSLLVIAPGFDHESLVKTRYMLTDMKNRFNAKSDLCFIVQPMSTQRDVNFIEDLCCVTGTNLLLSSMGDVERISEGKKNILEFVGYSKKTVVGKKVTTFLQPEIDLDKVEQTKSMIIKQREDMVDKKEGDIMKIYELSKRLAILNQNLVTIKIGGNTEQEKMTNKTLVQDAVAACKSAIRYGYCIGGNLMISIVSKELRDKVEDKNSLEYIIYDMIYQSFIKVYETILNNSTKSLPMPMSEVIETSLRTSTIYDLVNDKFTSDRVINSIETEEQILRNVISIVGLIATSNQFITSNPNELITFDYSCEE